jgi:hypothetical protein
MTRLIVAACLALALGAGVAQAAPPSLTTRSLLDFDHALQFPKNKQNEPSITRDPRTGVLIAGANDELNNHLCTGTTAPLTSPCPFTPGEPTSAYYRSTDDGATWTGGYLPGFDTIGRVSGGDPSLDVGPKRCSDGRFRWSCGSVVYYGSLADPFPEFGGEELTVSRSYDDGVIWSDPVEVSSIDRKSSFADHPWLAVDRGQSSPWFGHLYEFWTDNADSKGKYPSEQVVVISRDGGATFSQLIPVGGVTDYPLRGTPFDVVDAFNRVPGMSARVDCYPHPAADPTSNRVYVVWCDFTNGVGTVRGAYSDDGTTWLSLGTDGTVGAVFGRNAFFPAADVSPAGLLVVGFDALTAPAGDPWRTGTEVYDYYEVQGSAGGFTAPLRVSAVSSNPEASAYNNLQEQFIGDYTDLAAGPRSSFLVWTDASAAEPCPAVGAYQAQVYAGSKTAVAPNPDSVCPTAFGNTDDVVAVVRN